MLVRLAIQDIVLIETLELVFNPGLTVFTGETGAGKSIVLDALGLVLGERGDPGLVRQGCNQASVMAEFSLDTPSVTAMLEEFGIPHQDTLMLRRVLQRTGPSRAYINDSPVSVGLLKRLGEWLLEVHGQFDRLLAPALHRQALDAFAQVDGTAVRGAYQHWQGLESTHQRLSLEQELQEQNGVLLAAQVAEIAALNPQPGEEEELLSLRQRMTHGQRIEDALDQTVGVLTGGQQGALQALHGAEKTLQRVQDLLGAPGIHALAALSRSIIEVNEAAGLVTQMHRDNHFEPYRLQEIDDRLQLMRVVARKYMVTTDALVELLETAQQTLQHITDNADGVAALAQQKHQAQQAYVLAADALHAQRLQAKESLVARIKAELPALKLERAQFHVDITPLPQSQWGEHGTDAVVFQVATNPGQEPGALAKIASGGELARLMLALKVVLAQKNDIQTIVFDEIDQGVSGPVAAAIGERLARLAQNCQVLVITHSPQVAAAANQHFLVQKALTAGQMLTQVSVLTESTRQEELARMLSGQEITQEARAAAGQLLKFMGS
jgi:DNA repair protein RecN (Recombination protein N)